MSNANLATLDNSSIELSSPFDTNGLTKEYPIDFFQNKNLSADAIAVGAYLHSLPSQWQPRVKQLQQHFGFKDFIWRKVSKELRQEGYLTCIRLGRNKGTKLKFSIFKVIHNEFVPVENQRVQNEEDRKLDGLKNNGYISKETIVRSNNNNNNNNTAPPVDISEEQKLVVAFFDEMKIGAYARTKLFKYELSYLIEKIIYFRKQKEPKKVGWFIASLEKNYQCSERAPQNGPNSAIAATKELLDKQDASAERSRLGNKKLASEGIRTLKEILAGQPIES